MNSEFRQFVKDVRIKVPLTYNKLLKQAQNLIDEDVDATLTKIELSGSYSPKSKKQPTENSDIDLLVTYKGTAEPEQLVKALAGKLYGEFGFYDVQATKENSMKYTEKFYTMGRSEKLLISLYVNPSLDELRKYCPQGARAYVSLDGDLYVEGYEDLESVGNLSNVMHGAILKLIQSKDPTVLPSQNIDAVWSDPDMGIIMQRYLDTNEFYRGESQQEEADKEVLELARQKNPRLLLSGESITEKEEYERASKWGLLKGAEDLKESLANQFIQEIFQEDGEGGGVGGGPPAASISANPANLSTGSSSTLSKQAPEHMRLGVVTPFGNIPSKKKKTKKKGWPYN